MTALQIAKEWCANYNDNGSCLGAEIRDDGSILVCRPKPACVLTKTGVRCLYFEQCVAPNERQFTNPNDVQAWGEALHAYRVSTNAQNALARERVCPICGKAAVPHRKRMCLPCAAKKRRETWRNSANGKSESPINS